MELPEGKVGSRAACRPDIACVRLTLIDHGGGKGWSANGKKSDRERQREGSATHRYGSP